MWSSYEVPWKWHVYCGSYQGEAHILVAVHMFSLAQCTSSCMQCTHTHIDQYKICLYAFNSDTCSYSISQIIAMEHRKKFMFHVVTIFLFYIIKKDVYFFDLIPHKLSEYLMGCFWCGWCGWHFCVLLLGK